MFDSNIFVVNAPARRWSGGSSTRWPQNVGYSGIVAGHPIPTPRCFSSITFIRKKDEQFVVKGGLSSPRDDVESLVTQKFKKTYLEAKYSLDEYEKKLEEWEDLIQKLFVKKR